MTSLAVYSLWARRRPHSGNADRGLLVAQQAAWQVPQMRWRAAEHGLAMVRMFNDEARPGSTTVGRDGFEALRGSRGCGAAHQGSMSEGTIRRPFE